MLRLLLRHVMVRVYKSQGYRNWTGPDSIKLIGEMDRMKMSKYKQGESIIGLAQLN